jgi:hypothetical protein
MLLFSLQWPTVLACHEQSCSCMFDVSFVYAEEKAIYVAHNRAFEHPHMPLR